MQPAGLIGEQLHHSPEPSPAAPKKQPESRPITMYGGVQAFPCLLLSFIAAECIRFPTESVRQMPTNPSFARCASLHCTIQLAQLIPLMLESAAGSGAEHRSTCLDTVNKHSQGIHDTGCIKGRHETGPALRPRLRQNVENRSCQAGPHTGGRLTSLNAQAL